MKKLIVLIAMAISTASFATGKPDEHVTVEGKDLSGGSSPGSNPTGGSGSGSKGGGGNGTSTGGGGSGRPVFTKNSLGGWTVGDKIQGVVNGTIREILSRNINGEGQIYVKVETNEMTVTVWIQIKAGISKGSGGNP